MIMKSFPFHLICRNYYMKKYYSDMKSGVKQTENIVGKVHGHGKHLVLHVKP